MKAKEYMEKYGDAIIKETLKPEVSEAVKSFMQDLLDEVLALRKQRNALRGAAIIAVFDEINKKYNAVARLLEKKAGEPVLKKDGFKKICCKHFETEPYMSYVMEKWAKGEKIYV